MRANADPLYFLAAHTVSAILNLHRQFFTLALSEGLWANHKYACSVVAVYQAALSLLRGLETYYRQQPEYSVRQQILWFEGLSAAVSSWLSLASLPLTECLVGRWHCPCCFAERPPR